MNKALPILLAPGLTVIAALAFGAAAEVAPKPAEVAPRPTEISADAAEIKTVGNDTKGVFTGSVTLVGTNLKLAADRLEILAESKGPKDVTVPQLEKFKYLIATGHVRITQGNREATAGRAEVLPREEKLILSENPIVIVRDDDGKPSTFAGLRIEWRRGDAGLTIDQFRGTVPEIRDLGFAKEKKEKEQETPAVEPRLTLPK